MIKINLLLKFSVVNAIGTNDGVNIDSAVSKGLAVRDSWYRF